MDILYVCLVAEFIIFSAKNSYTSWKLLWWTILLRIRDFTFFMPGYGWMWTWQLSQLRLNFEHNNWCPISQHATLMCDIFHLALRVVSSATRICVHWLRNWTLALHEAVLACGVQLFKLLRYGYNTSISSSMDNGFVANSSTSSCGVYADVYWMHGHGEISFMIHRFNFSS